MSDDLLFAVFHAIDNDDALVFNPHAQRALVAAIAEGQSTNPSHMTHLNATMNMLQNHMEHLARSSRLIENDVDAQNTIIALAERVVAATTGTDPSALSNPVEALAALRTLINADAALRATADGVIYHTRPLAFLRNVAGKTSDERRRGIAHAMIFMKNKQVDEAPLSQNDIYRAAHMVALATAEFRAHAMKIKT